MRARVLGGLKTRLQEQEQEVRLRRQLETRMGREVEKQMAGGGDGGGSCGGGDGGGGGGGAGDGGGEGEGGDTGEYYDDGSYLLYFYECFALFSVTKYRKLLSRIAF